MKEELSPKHKFLAHSTLCSISAQTFKVGYVFHVQKSCVNLVGSLCIFVGKVVYRHFELIRGHLKHSFGINEKNDRCLPPSSE